MASSKTASLFRAIVVAGAAITGGAACSGSDSHGTDSGPTAHDAGEMRDAVAALDSGPELDAGPTEHDAGMDAAMGPVDSGATDAGEDAIVLII